MVTQGTEECTIFQIDYTEDHVGKNKPESKRIIRWRYGFAGENDAAAKEHEVVLIWSVRSGKRIVEFDGKEVEYSRKRGASIYNFEWTAFPGHKLQVLATRVTPLKSPAHFRRYELLINGRSFFMCPRPGESPRKVLRNNYGPDNQNQVPLSILDIIYPEKRNEVAYETHSDFDGNTEGPLLVPESPFQAEEEIVFDQMI